MVKTIILALLGLLIIIEGSFVVFRPKQTRTLTLKMLKNSKTLKTVGIIELIFGIIIVVLAIS